MQEVTGHCPHCGAPIYTHSGAWMSILPPLPIFTCGCTSASRQTYTTTDGTVAKNTA